MSAYDFSPLSAGWHLVAAALVLTLPGLAWVAWFPARGKDIVARLADAAGVSLALTALFGLALFLVGWSLSPGAVVFLYGAAGLSALAARYAPRLARRLSGRAMGPGEESAKSAEGAVLPTPRREAAIRSALVVALFALVLAWRLYQARDLVLPAWVDSLHHVLIVRLILENGGLPGSFEPYMPVPFYYHFAFHLVTAAYAFWSRLGPALATLLLGQALNAAVALAVYRLALALWEDWRRAGAAALLVGFVTQMPAYYVTWGRYTLLAGLILLPMAMAAAVEIARQGWNGERVARLALLTGGLLLTHYFVAALLALFLSLQALLVALERKPDRERARSKAWVALLAGGGVGALLAFPWFLRVWGYASAYTRIRTILPSQSLDQAYFADYLPYLWYLMGPNRNVLLLALAVLSLAYVGWRRRERALTLWTAGLLAIGFPWGPQLSPFRPDHAVIVLFLPATLFLGDGLVTAGDRLKAGRLARPGGVAVVAVLVALVVWGVRETNQILNPVTVLAQDGDLQAVEWVAANTPPDARFYINVTLWQRDLYRGVDGGWWILPLTGRATLVPPTLYQLGEPGYVAQVNVLAEAATLLQGCTPELSELIQTGGIDFIYLGVNPGALTAANLADCEFLHPVYDREGVSIYQVEP